jgi:SNW domain-containing protein 1
MDRDEGRDISEKIALGMHKGSGKLSGEAMYDSRLFNQSAGMDSGFGADDDYSTYSKPLFEARSEATSIYRPRQDDSDIYGSAEDQVIHCVLFSFCFKN